MLNVLVTLLLIFVLAILVSIIRPNLFKILFKSLAKRSVLTPLFSIIATINFLAIGFISQNGAQIITHPSTDNDIVYGQLFQGALSNTATKFTEAHLYTDALLRANPDEVSKEDWLKLGDETRQKWQDAKDASDEFMVIADAMPNYKEPKMVSNNYLGLSPRAFAADPAFREFFKRKESIASDQAYIEKLNLVDVAPSKRKLTTAAKLFNTDIYKAKAIVDNHYQQISSNAIQFADMMGAGSKASSAIATTSDIALFVGGLYTGSSELTLIGKAGQLKNIVNVITTAIAGSNLALNIGETGGELGIFSSETGAAFSKAKDAKFLNAINTLISIKDLSKALTNFASIKTAISKSGNGSITKQSISKFMSNSNEVKLLSDNLKENGMDNMKTIYDWVAQAGTFSGKNYAELVDIEGQSTTILDTATISQPSKTIYTTNLNTNRVPISFVVNNGQVISMFSALNTLSIKDTKDINSSASEEVQIKTPAINYDGYYSGNDNVASGIASANITVTGNTLSGGGGYKQAYAEGTFRMGLSISGILSEGGRVSGSVSGSGSISDQTYSVYGTFTGKIEDGVMRLSYNASGSAGSASGKINLYK